MKLKIIFWCCAAILLWNCTDDDDSHSTYTDVNWFEIKDNPNDELQHLTYLIYKESGIPIFYNDTIGSEERGIDANGNPIIYYEILNVGYQLSSTNTNLAYGISKNTNNLKLGIELLRDKVIARLPAKVHIPSFLLVDTLNYMDFHGYRRIEADCYSGFMTTAIGRMERIHEMTEREKAVFSGEILGTVIGNYLNNKYDKQLEEFYTVSRSIRIEDPYGYGRYDYGMYDVNLESSTGEKEEFGFLIESKNKIGYPGYNYTTPKEIDDLISFIAAYYTWDESEFKQAYEPYEHVLAKYAWIKSFMKNTFEK